MLKRTISITLAFLILSGMVSIYVFHMIEETSEPEYCVSCHEMELFYDAWAGSAHGYSDEGSIEAACTDCHLPHNGTINYLITKAQTGIHDLWAHHTGVDTDWHATREHRNSYTYNSGCSKCHVELVAPGIPLKAVHAHRDYELGIVEKTCVDCHVDTGHGDLVSALEEKGIMRVAESGGDSGEE